MIQLSVPTLCRLMHNKVLTYSYDDNELDWNWKGVSKNIYLWKVSIRRFKPKLHCAMLCGNEWKHRDFH
jgi:hypothetical protein